MSDSDVRVLQKAPAKRWLVYIIMIICWAQIYIGMQTVATYGTNIIADLGVNNSMLALISNGVTLALGIMCVASGIVAVRLGGKKTIMLGAAIQLFAGLLFFVNIKSVGFLFFARILEGVGAGLINAYALSLIAAWFPRKQRAFATGLQMGLYGVAVSSTAFFVAIFNSMGLNWQQGIGTFVSGAAILCLILVGFLYTDIEKQYGVSVIDDAIIGDDEEKAVETAGAAATSVKQGKSFTKASNYSELFKSPVFWLWALPMGGVTALGYNLPYCFPMLFPSYGYTAAETATVMGIAFMGTILFGPIGGIISDRLFHGRRASTIALSLGSSAIIMLLFIFLVTAHASIGVIVAVAFIAYGLCLMANGPIWALPVDIFDTSFFPRANGVSLLFCNLMGLANIAITGALADSTGSYMPGVIVSVVFTAVCFLCAFVMAKRYKV